MGSKERLVTPQPYDAVAFDGSRLLVIDQTLLPSEELILELTTPEETASAIRRLAVRGAMAIGVAAAYGVVLGAIHAAGDAESARWGAKGAIDVIGASRPTARNLFWALERMQSSVEEGAGDDREALVERLTAEADRIAFETIETNRRLVEAGLEVVPGGAAVLTHCNSGPLAALRYGTALGVLIEAHRRGKGVHVFADETRPLLQGSRLTAWELARDGVPYTILPDGASGALMKSGRVDLVMTGADRIAANGDSANKVGTYTVATLARAHSIPFYIAAPGSTVDLETPDGDSITIEERGADEVVRFAGVPVAPEGSAVFNPSFDVTPAGLIAGIVTEEGVLRPPYEESLSVFRH